jgi:hypothetical protein
VNWAHFRTLVWLRWRLLANQMRKGGTTNIVVAIILVVGGIALAVGMAFGLFMLGWAGLADASPEALMYVWDVLAGLFLIFWLVGLSVELQRAEALSLSKFMHLPVALRSAFVINYLSSLVNLCMIFFVPAMIGLAVGLVLSRGPLLLLVFPLLAAFLLAVTALTYQFQGWLAALMSNPRRRRTIIVVTTAVIVLLAQVPNFLNMMNVWGGGDTRDVIKQIADRRQELDAAKQAKSLPPEEIKRRDAELDREFQAVMDRTKRGMEATRRTVRLVSAIVPPGWLPLGVEGLAEGNPLPALLGTAGLGLIGGVSLRRAYRTTLSLYTGELTGRKTVAAHPASPTPETVISPSVAARPRLVEWRLPWVSEQAAAIALAGFRGLVRAPEAKMLLLSPVILLVLLGSMAAGRRAAPPDAARPFIAAGVLTAVLLGLGQVACNLFGFDRAGFRVFVLSSARRSDILLGKNLSLAPLGLGLGVIALVIFQALYPMKIDHFLAALPQAVSIYLLYSFGANWISIMAPMAIAAGAMRPSNTRLVPVLLHLAFTFLIAILLAPTLLPLGIEYALEWAGWPARPAALVLSLALCAGVITLYLLALRWQGNVLQAREKRILEVVTSKAE